LKDRPSSRPIYPLGEAARFARADPAKVRRWLQGYEVASRRYEPLLAPPRQTRGVGGVSVSFENLIEIALVSTLRSKKISLQTIREAHRIAVGEFGPHPFARRDVFVSGKDLFMRASESVDDSSRDLTALTRGGQRALQPVLERYLTHIDWEEGWPVEWRPMEGIVSQNPEIVFGLPNVRGVRTEILRARFEASESIGFLSEDYGIDPAQVEEALRYEFWLRSAA